MADVHTKEQRSFNMSQIRNKDTKPEMVVRKYLHSHGFRYLIHDKRLPGKPDIVLPKYRTVIFVNGCFWHGHEDCKYFKLPKTREDWWRNKILRNLEIDTININKIKQDNWNIISVFECELSKNKFNLTMDSIINKLEARYI
jgi:DNA mismatch endonuclease (patch repair protein)